MNKKRKDSSNAEIYRKLASEIMKREGVIDLDDLIIDLKEARKIEENIMPCYLITSLLEDPDHSYVFFSHVGRKFVCFLEDFRKIHRML